MTRIFKFVATNSIENRNAVITVESRDKTTAHKLALWAALNLEGFANKGLKVTHFPSELEDVIG